MPGLVSILMSLCRSVKEACQVCRLAEVLVPAKALGAADAHLVRPVHELDKIFEHKPIVQVDGLPHRVDVGIFHEGATDFQG